MRNTTPAGSGRHDVVFADALRRVQHDYLEMPGLQLTLPQAARLWALDAALCGEVFNRLVETGFLVRVHGAAFARAADRHAGA